MKQLLSDPAMIIRRSESRFWDRLRFPTALRRIAILSAGDADTSRVIARLEHSLYGCVVLDVSLNQKSDLDHLDALARQRLIDEVLLVINGGDEASVTSSIERLVAYPVDIAVYFGVYAEAISSLTHARFRNQFHSVLLFRQPMRGWKATSKQALDRVISIAAIAMLAPIFVLIAAAIKLDSKGPVFYRQTRNGLDKRTFKVWKFRTMNVMEEEGLQQARRVDPRVTRVGRMLRRTSFDELPQLFNVLTGEMSLVGPRPHPCFLDDRFTEVLRLYNARHRVLPGITGLAQINGCRGETETDAKMAARLKYDLEYIANWSLWLDLKILAATLLGKFLHPNAY